MEEIWKDVPNYEGLYQVSNLGRVKSLDREFLDKKGKLFRRKGAMITLVENEYGYLAVRLNKNNTRKEFKVHRLVLMTFSPCDNMENLEVNHKDFNRKNNSLNNLEWLTHKENLNYSKANYANVFIGSKNPKATFTEEQIKTIREMYQMGWSISQIVYELYQIDRKTDLRLYKNLHGKISDIVNYRTWKHIA